MRYQRFATVRSVLAALMHPMVDLGFLSQANTTVRHNKHAHKASRNLHLPTHSHYYPHQGKRECARRRRQIERGQCPLNQQLL